MSESNIWNKILFVDSIILVVSGAIFGLLPVISSDFTGSMYNMIYGVTLSVEADALRYMNFLLSLVGVVMLGWGSMATFLSYKMLKVDNEIFWTAFTISLVVWFVEDTFISIYFGATGNIYLNTIFLVLFLIPILGRRFS